MTEFDLSERDHDDSIEDVKEAFREWADRNNFEVFEDSPNDGWVMAKITDYKMVRLDRFGNIELVQRSRANLSDGSIKFTDKSLIGKPYDRPDVQVNQNSFPVWRNQ